jgi:chromosomal replication initiation ATPase DnaA
MWRQGTNSLTDLFKQVRQLNPHMGCAMHESVQNTEFSPANQPPTDEVLTNLVEALQSALAHAAASPAVLQALREVHRIQTAASEAVTLSTISDRVASAFRLAPVDLTNSRKRDARTVMARQIAICISRRLTKASLPVLGRHYHRDHATIHYAVNLIDRRMTEPTFRQFVEKLEAQICATAATEVAA